LDRLLECLSLRNEARAEYDRLNPSLSFPSFFYKGIVGIDPVYSARVSWLIFSSGSLPLSFPLLFLLGDERRGGGVQRSEV